MSKNPHGLTSRHFFHSRSVAYGLLPGEFDDLPSRARKKLVRLIARISEKSYRRGFHHGVEIGDERTLDPATLRHKRSLDQSPFTDGPGGFTAIERLFMECPELDRLGFDDRAYNKQRHVARKQAAKETP